MNWYFSRAQSLLGRTDLDPFYVCAWLQWTFLYIHPFTDGNGRVARMISSIPLLKSKLPPVVVVQERRSKYFHSLSVADQSGDLTPLASFLNQEADEAISYIRSELEQIQVAHISPESERSDNSHQSYSSPPSLEKAIEKGLRSL